MLRTFDFSGFDIRNTRRALWTHGGCFAITSHLHKSTGADTYVNQNRAGRVALWDFRPSPDGIGTVMRCVVANCWM